MANLEQFKSIESYPIIPTVPLDFSKYNDYIQEAVIASRLMEMDALKRNQFIWFDGFAR